MALDLTVETRQVTVVPQSHWKDQMREWCLSEPRGWSAVMWPNLEPGLQGMGFLGMRVFRGVGEGELFGRESAGAEDLAAGFVLAG